MFELHTVAHDDDLGNECIEKDLFHLGRIKAHRITLIEFLRKTVLRISPLLL